MVGSLDLEVFSNARCREIRWRHYAASRDAVSVREFFSSGGADGACQGRVNENFHVAAPLLRLWIDFPSVCKELSGVKFPVEVIYFHLLCQVLILAKWKELDDVANLEGRHPKLTKYAIQQRLREIGAKVTGNKHDLMRRLEQWEENNLKRKLVETVIVPSQTRIDFPPPDKFSPLKILKSTEIQPITLTVIDDWFGVRQATTSKEKGRLLCLKKFVKSVVVLKEGSLLLVKARCAAATKRNSEYLIKVVFSTNILEPGILQAECQCAAGDGYSAACKHVAAIAYCIEHYARSDVSLELVPCSSVLQSWHRPPASGRNLTPKTIEEIVGKTSVSVGLPHKGTGNDDLFNFMIGSSVPSPILHSRAVNVFGYQNDYNFIPGAPTEMLIMEQINFVTLHSVKEIEKKTRQQADSKMWRQERRTRLTASGAGNIVRTVKNKNFAKGPAERQLSTRKLRGPAISWGKDKEKIAIKEYENITGLKVQSHGLQVDVNSHFLAASPDGKMLMEYWLRLSALNIRDKEPVMAQCLKKVVKNGVVSYYLKRNHNYYMQCQLQMHVCSVRKLDFVVYTTKSVYIEPIFYDPDFCETVMYHLDEYYRKVFAPIAVSSMWEREKMEGRGKGKF